MKAGPLGARELKPIFILLFIFLLAAEGCVSGPRSPPQGGSPEHLPSGSSLHPPSVLITYPEFDGGVHAGTVTVTILTRNFSVVDHSGKTNAAGEGHLVCFLDAAPPTDPDAPAMSAQGTFQESAQAWCTWYDVSAGTHTFAVELVNNDNTPLVPPVLDAVDVTAV